MPYKKGSLAEQLGKVRRTAKRRIASLEKAISKTGNEREQNFYRQQISRLRDDIDKTYQVNPTTRRTTGYSNDQLRIAGNILKRTISQSSLGRGMQGRRNFVTQQELNNAESYTFIGPTQSRYTKEEVNIFYAATKEAWQGLPPIVDRNKAILEYYKRKGIYEGGDLAEFVDVVLEMNEKAVARAFREVDVEDIEQAEPEEYKGSPTYLVDVVSVTMWNELNSYLNEP